MKCKTVMKSILFILFICPIAYASPIYNLGQYSYSFRDSIGMSYNTAIASFANNGWTVATPKQVQDLFLDLTGFTNYSAWTNNFDWRSVLHATIGVTFENNTVARANFYFGVPYANGSRVDRAQIFDWADPQSGNYREISQEYWDWGGPSFSDPLLATMFVRNKVSIPNAPTIALFVIGVVALWQNRNRVIAKKIREGVARY